MQVFCIYPFLWISFAWQNEGSYPLRATQRDNGCIYLVLLHVNIEHILLSYCLGIFFSYISTHIVFIIINFFFFWLNADYIPWPTIMQAGNDKMKFHASTIWLWYICMGFVFVFFLVGGGGMGNGSHFPFVL